jgi:hypothetical protein
VHYKVGKIELKILFVLLSICLGLIEENKGIPNFMVQTLDPEHGGYLFFNLKKCKGTLKT